MGDAARSIFSASIALLAGYSFIRLSYYRRFRAEHLRTDRYTLHVLGLSFVLFLAGSLAAELIPHWTFSRLWTLERGLEKVGITAAVINAIVFGLVAISRLVGRSDTSADIHQDTTHQEWLQRSEHQEGHYHNAL